VIYALNDKFRVVVGPNMQALYDVKLYSEETDYTTSFIGLNAGVELHIDRFILGSYYASPLRSVGIYGSSMTYQSVQLRLGYSIF